MGHRILASKTVLFFAAVAALCGVLLFGADITEASGYSQSYYNNSYSQGYYSNSYYEEPTCSMTLTYQTEYNRNGSYRDDPAILNWTSSNATSASISPNVGSVSTNGSRTVYPRGNQTYSMQVWGRTGSGNCYVTAVHPYASMYSGNYSSQYNTYPTYDYYYPDYSNYYTSYPVYTYSAQTASYVALSKVPYTGADFGFYGTLLSWLLVVIAASVGAGAIAHRAGYVEKVRVRFRG